MNDTSMMPNRKPSNHLERYSESDLPTSRGTFRIIVFKDKRNGHEHVAMVHGEPKAQDVLGAKLRAIGMEDVRAPGPGDSIEV